MFRTILAGTLLSLVVTLATPAHAQTATTTQSDTEIATTTSPIPFNQFDPVHVEAKVRTIFADIPVMIKIAKCESNFRQFDSSGNPLYGGTGGMVGVFQVAAAVHNKASRGLNYDINSLDGNLAYALYLYENEGTVPWLASAHCWNPQPIATALKVGSSGTSVKVLQQMLNRNGYPIAKEGEGSPGLESTFFGPLTRESVKRFQCDMRIVCSGSEKTSGYGMVGAKTKQALLKIDAKNAQVSSPSSLSKK